MIQVSLLFLCRLVYAANNELFLTLNTRCL